MGLGQAIYVSVALKRWMDLGWKCEESLVWGVSIVIWCDAESLGSLVPSAYPTICEIRREADKLCEIKQSERTLLFKY